MACIFRVSNDVSQSIPEALLVELLMYLVKVLQSLWVRFFVNTDLENTESSFMY